MTASIYMNTCLVTTQVTVSGQFVVCSRLSRALEVRFHLRDSELVGDAEAEEREFTMVVEGGGAGPSLVLEHEDMKGVSVRLAGHPHLPWSHSLHLSGHAMHTNQLLKVRSLLSGVTGKRSGGDEMSVLCRCLGVGGGVKWCCTCT